ncbi:MAG: double-strand break repair helicase AddA [Xanthobacteraceae bacterium]|nr:MAG: double-strand break repair helicase AddA [Xanthobacteraceae bacterium]
MTRPIPDSIRRDQAAAADPAISAFVAANAGAGKTHVLVQRVIRLLLAGTPPERILCITFTKAAAATMAQRVFATLGQWIALDDEPLDRALRAAGIAMPDARLRGRARELFARALETPGGLKVQTIHALCTRLLQQFPFEAGVVARFAVLDDRDRDEMMGRASLAVLLEAAAEPDSTAGRALTTAMAYAADATFRDVVNDAILSRDGFGIKSPGEVPAAIADLCAALGITPDLTMAELDATILDGPHLPPAQWPAAAGMLALGSSSDRNQATRLRAALSATGAERCAAYLDVFFTKGSGDKPPGRRAALITKDLAAKFPALAASLDAEATRLAPLVEQRKALIVRERTEALIVLATAIAEAYRRDKAGRGLLDYDDLIDRTLDLLANVSSAWVHYKLDQGIDHVLIDEAQDTSPKQWNIVTHLVSEFAVGEGGRDGVRRTLFAVGDDKQSIYSFQGAVTREFDERRRGFARMFRQASLDWRDIRLTYSFRSGPSILVPLKYVFRAAEVHASVTADADGLPAHLALEDAAPGAIELWDLEQPAEKADIEGWRAPFDATAQTSPQVRLARRIAARIGALIADGEMTGTGAARRRLSPGDFLVLVRKRGVLFEAVIQALKQARIAVAGADRLKLTEHIAVTDLMALTDALLSPHDELALATVLKSPLFNLTDDDLFTIAWKRKGTLRQSLEAHAAHGAPFEAAWRRWRAYESRATRDMPFSFYAWVLGGDGGRARMLRRLGMEANEALDEFLALALAYERREAASLQGFMHWLRAADIEIKRDLEIARDEVRVMTVHGAKGLEAPVVILADTASAPADGQKISLVRLPRGNAAHGAAPMLVWAGRRNDDPPALAAARGAMKQDTEDEYRRLLYVAMTRAMERLIVCGCQPGNVKEVKPSWWYALIADGLISGVEAGALEVEDTTTPDGTVRRYRARGDAAFESQPGAAAAPGPPMQLPDWLHRQSAPGQPAQDWLRPSDLDETMPASAARASSASRRLARRRGTLAHRLLQSLPDVAAERRTQTALRFLAGAAPEWAEADRADLARQALAVIDDARFAAVFAAGSRAEVPIVGHLARPGRAPLAISGQIDRLAAAEKAVLLVDFKTASAPPAEIPAAYRRQLALYRALLGAIYPGRLVRAALLWTETLEIMEVSSAELDAELTRVLAP